MEFLITNKVIEWRGPAPYFYLPIDEDESAEIKSVAHEYTFGWGVLYVTCTLKEFSWVTAVFPKDGRYLVPLRKDVREKFDINLGDKVTLRVRMGKNA